MTDDLALPDDPNHEAAPAPEPQPAPGIDINAAMDAVAQHYGWDPRVADYEARELKQRKERLDQRERDLRELEDRTRRSNQPDPADLYNQDPSRLIADLYRKVDEMDKRERQREERVERETREQREFTSTFARFSKPFNGKLDEDAFFATMREIYPQGVPEGVGLERAFHFTHRVMSANPVNGNYQAPPPARGRRDTIVIPSGTTGGAGPPEPLEIPRRQPNEPEEQFAQRYNAWAQQFAAGTGALRDGQKISSG